MYSGRKQLIKVLILAVLVVLFQNCNKVRFSEPELESADPSGPTFNPKAVSYLKISMNEQSAFTAQAGISYTLKVEASADIVEQGLDLAATRLVKVGGNCKATHLMPLMQKVETSVQVASVPPLLMDGASSSWTVLPVIPDPAVSVDPSLPVVDVVAIDPATIDQSLLPVPVENYVDLGDLNQVSMGQQQAFKVSAKTGGSGEELTAPVTSVSGAAGFSVGDNQFDYQNAAAENIGGCDWLACVKAKSGLEACVQISATKVGATIPPVVVPVTTTTQPPLGVVEFIDPANLKLCPAAPIAANVNLQPRTLAGKCSKIFEAPRKAGLPVATFGCVGWTTWDQWCKEQGYEEAYQVTKGSPARPCAGNFNGKDVYKGGPATFTGWRMNWNCNYAAAAQIVCMKTCN